MPRGQAKNVTETRTRGRKIGASKDDNLSPPPLKKTKSGSSKAVRKGRKKNHGTLNEDLDIENNKNEMTEKLLDKDTIQIETHSDHEEGKDNLRASRKRKFETEATEDMEGKITEDKSMMSKVPLTKKGRSESSSEKEDASKEADCKTPFIGKKEGNLEVGLRRTRNTRQSGSFSSDAEKEMEKRNPVDIHAISEHDKQENKHKNKSTKEVESYSSDGEKKSSQQPVSNEPRKREVKVTHQTRNTRQTANLGSVRESDLKQQYATDTSTDTELLPEDEKRVSKTRCTRRTESLSSDGERDLKQQNAASLSSDNDAVQRREAGRRVTRYTRRTESLSSDGERDAKQQTSTDNSTDNKLAQQRPKGAHRTRNTRQAESSSSDAERDNKQQNAVEAFEGNIPKQVEKGVRKTRNMRTESLSSERETGLETQQNITTTAKLGKEGVKNTRETRSSRRSGSYSSDREKDSTHQSFKNKTAVQPKSGGSDLENGNNPAMDSDIVNIVASNTNIETLNDIGKENVSNEKIKPSSRRRRAKRFEDSCSDRENEKTEEDQSLKFELEIELNKNEEKKESENEISLHETMQSKQVHSNSDGENQKNKDGSLSSDESIKIINDIETDIEQDVKDVSEKMDTFKVKTRNKGRNIKAAQEVYSLSDKEDKIRGKVATVGRRTRNVRKRKGSTPRSPEIQDSIDEIKVVEVVNEIKEKPSVRRGKRKTKNLNKVEREDRGSKEFSDKETIEETDIASVKASNAKKSKGKIYQDDQNKEEFDTEHKTRNASEKEMFMIESNDELLEDDFTNNTTRTAIVEINLVEKTAAHKIATSKKKTRASKGSQGSDLDSCKAEDSIVHNRMDASASSNTGIAETLKESEINPINVDNGNILEDKLPSKVQASNEVNENTEPCEKFPLLTQGRRRRGRVTKMRAQGKMSTRSIKKFSQDWKQNVSLATNQITEVENKESDSHAGYKGIADIQVCKKVSVVIKRLDLNDPLIYKLISNYDLEILQAGKENCEQHVKSSNVCQIVEKCDKPSEPCEITNKVGMMSEKETDSIAVLENENGIEVEQTNMTIYLPNEVIKESSEITSPKNTQFSSSSDIDSFSTSEITFENATEKETFESIVERYVAENVNIGIVDPENTFLTDELSCLNPLTLEKYDKLDENSETDHNTAHEKSTELKINCTEDQENENTAIDGSENFSESILSTNLDLETLTAKSNGSEILSPDVFSKNIDLQETQVMSILDESEIDDSKLVDRAVNEDGASENEELLEIVESNGSERETEIEFTDSKESREYEDAYENSDISLLESTCKYGDNAEKNEKLIECFENSAATTFDNKSLLDSETAYQNSDEVEEKMSRYIAKNSNSDLYDENNEKCVDIFINPPDSKMMEKDPENFKNPSIEESLVEDESNKDSDSGTSVDHPNEVLNLKENSVIVPSYDENKLDEIGSKSDQSMDKYEQNERLMLHTESEMLEKVDSNILSAIEDDTSLNADDISVEMGLELAECTEEESVPLNQENENTDISVELCNVDLDKVCSEKEDIESTQMSDVCTEDLASKINLEVTSDKKEVSRSFLTSMSLPERNLAEAASEDSLLNDSDTVLKEVSEVVGDMPDQVNDAFVCCDGTNELQADENAPATLTEEIEIRKTKTYILPEEVLTDVGNIEHEDKDRIVKEFVNIRNTGDLQDCVKHVRERELRFDGIDLQTNIVSDSATNRYHEKEIQMVRTSVADTCLVTDKSKPNAGSPEILSEMENHKSSEKHTEDFNEISLSGNQFQPGPSSVNSQSKKPCMKPKITEVKPPSIPRWPRMPFAPVRMYLEQFVPLLMEGLVQVSSIRPNNPIQYLAHWMEENKADAYYKMKQSNLKRSKGQISNPSDGKKQGR